MEDPNMNLVLAIISGHEQVRAFFIEHKENTYIKASNRELHSTIIHHIFCLSYQITNVNEL